MANRYVALLRFPGARTILFSGAVARLPVSMYALGLLLLVQSTTGSLTSAGLVAAAAAIGYAVAGPALGRLVDRYGPGRLLVTTAIVNMLTFAMVILLAKAPIFMLSCCALLIGATLPPVAACQRALWRRVLPAELVDTAFALDSICMDVYLIAGPLLVTGLVVVAGPAIALAVTGLVLAVGSLFFATVPGNQVVRVARRDPHLLGPLREPGFRLLVGTIAAAGLALGAVRVALVGYAEDGGDAALGGLLYAAIGIGSAAGGLWYGSRKWRGGVEIRYPVLLAAYAVCALPLLTGRWPLAMFLLGIITGLALSPVTICEFALVGRCAPSGTVAEAYAWATTATFAGSALGNALAGGLVDRVGWRAAIGLAVLALAIAAAATAWRRDLFRPPKSPSPAPAQGPYENREEVS
ncbi:MFS transporter [Fodinicola acaciae]|uniref:MFS transporter n=1 Tax=Fodinicola acaciae TaxID=2681555 RepID=UPI0013D083CD|nr:MFS transporter [Fodinicola acaciae]